MQGSVGLVLKTSSDLWMELSGGKVHQGNQIIKLPPSGSGIGLFPVPSERCSHCESVTRALLILLEDTARLAFRRG